ASGALRELAARLRLGGVRFAGALARPAVALRYRQADVFVLTPHHEAFGNVFAEALASGLPVVGSEVGGVPELIREGLNGFLVAPDDPLAVVQALQRLESDPALRARLGAHNRADAEARLSWKAVTQRYLDLYASLHAARAASRQEAA
ncbi:MAG: glycosyltransferase family 4 protein, partial [Gemmatimonadota bacterium]